MSTIIREEDKFNGRTISTLNHKWVLKKASNLTEIKMSIDFNDYREAAYENINKIVEIVEDATGIPQNRLAIPEEGDYTYDEKHSAIRIKIELQSKNWWFLHRGALIFLADGKKNNLGAPASRKSGTGTVKENKETHVVCNEHCLYLISKNDLKSICDSQNVEIQLSGDSLKHECSLDGVGVDYFKLFYNKVFDNSIYNDAVERLDALDKEWKKLLVSGGLGGCLVPIILFIILAFTLGEKEDFGWTGCIPIILAIGVWVVLYVKYSRKREKLYK